jgi:hypothetical protein
MRIVGEPNHQQRHDSFAMAGHNGYLWERRWRLRWPRSRQMWPDRGATITTTAHALPALKVLVIAAYRTVTKNTWDGHAPRDRAVRVHVDLVVPGRTPLMVRL